MIFYAQKDLDDIVTSYRKNNSSTACMMYSKYIVSNMYTITNIQHVPLET